MVTKKDMDATQTLTSNEEHFPSPETSPGGRLDPNRNRVMYGNFDHFSASGRACHPPPHTSCDARFSVPMFVAC